MIEVLTTDGSTKVTGNLSTTGNLAVTGTTTLTGTAVMTGGINGNLKSSGVFQNTPLGGVGSLPACTAALEGAFTGVTNASATTYNSVVAGGGTNHMPVYCNGTAWVLH
jgi:hypothetical protein